MNIFVINFVVWIFQMWYHHYCVKMKKKLMDYFTFSWLNRKKKTGDKFIIKIFKRWQMAHTNAMTVTWLSGLWIYFRSTSRSFVWEGPLETQTVYDSGRGYGPMMTLSRGLIPQRRRWVLFIADYPYRIFLVMSFTVH